MELIVSRLTDVGKQQLTLHRLSIHLATMPQNGITLGNINKLKEQRPEGSS
jgi:hypothetical protein